VTYIHHERSHKRICAMVHEIRIQAGKHFQVTVTGLHRERFFKRTRTGTKAHRPAFSILLVKSFPVKTPISPDCFYNSDMLFKEKFTAAINSRGKTVLNRPLRAASGVSCIEVHGVRSGRKHSCWKQRSLETASTE
jgi:hypothetical protein